MSYDLAAFDLSVAPENAASFQDWYLGVMDGDAEPTGVKTGSPLGSWVALMEEEFPNEDDATDDTGDNEEDLADYSSSYPALVYVAFSWEVVERARTRGLEAAGRVNVGIFALSDDVPSVYVPNGSGGMTKKFEF
ncbi:hypothetical protein GCM10009624_36320 [Gordonia sinesedis]